MYYGVVARYLRRNVDGLHFVFTAFCLCVCSTASNGVLHW